MLFWGRSRTVMNFREQSKQKFSKHIALVVVLVDGVVPIADYPATMIFASWPRSI